MNWIDRWAVALQVDKRLSSRLLSPPASRTMAGNQWTA